MGSGPPEDQPGWKAHADFVDALIEDGTFVMGGPFSDYSGSVNLLEGVSAAEAADLLAVTPSSGTASSSSTRSATGRRRRRAERLAGLVETDVLRALPEDAAPGARRAAPAFHDRCEVVPGQPADLAREAGRAVREQDLDLRRGHRAEEELACGGVRVCVLGPRPSSSSKPIGTEAASPLQRAWTSWL